MDVNLMEEFKKSGAVDENTRIWKAVDKLSSQALVEASEANLRKSVVEAERQLGRLDAYAEVKKILLAMKW
jgi:hypothetical protein